MHKTRLSSDHSEDPESVVFFSGSAGQTRTPIAVSVMMMMMWTLTSEPTRVNLDITQLSLASAVTFPPHDITRHMTTDGLPGNHSHDGTRPMFNSLLHFRHMGPEQ